MSKDRTFRQKRKTSIQRIGAVVVATMLVVALAVGLIPSNTGEVLAADKTMNMEGFSATMIADPHTSEDDHIFNGTPAEDGKIWTDKSVTTGAMYGLTAKEEHFTVALSALAQTYNTVTTGMTTEQQNVAYDVVFVLDFSGSMNDRTDSDDNQSPRKAKAMVDALNPAISTLMENENSRIAVVGYSGSNVNASSATTILDLSHYNTTAKDTENNNLYFQYTRSNNSGTISTVSGVTKGTTAVSESMVVNGGTPTQRGIYRAMDLLRTQEKPEDDIVRIPIIVLLTDGEAGSARSDYRTLSGGTFYQGSANGNGSSSQNDEVGAYTVLTANYAKTTVDTLYKSRYDYTNILKTGDSAAKFYTIGLGIDGNSWTRFMLDPGANISNTTVTNMKSTLSSDTTYGSNYDYSDAYYGGENMTADDLNNAFAGIVADLQVQPQVSSSVNDPVTTETTSVTGANVTFTDYLGYKMELKGDSQYLRYKGVNYRFDKRADNTYVFSGYNQDGDAVTGPVVTKGDDTYTLTDVIFKAEYVSEEYNNQTGYWVIKWEFPGPLMPTYSRLTDYDNTDLEPIRMLYEVGLAEDANLWTDGLKIAVDGTLLEADATSFDKYVFHTNLFNYKDQKAMTWSEYTPAKDNPYYYETGYVVNKEVAQTDTEYIRLDMVATGTKMGEIQGTANVVLSNIDVSLSDARATFTYKGTEYRVDLTGDSTSGATWSGEVSIPVTAQTTDGQEISVNVAVRIEATYEDGFWFFDSLNLSKVTVHGEEATITNSTATKNDLIISTWGEIPDETTEEIVSVYMELKKDDQGYYVEDSKNNRIEVKKVDGSEVYTVTLEDKTYYSDIYYKYKEGTESYVSKELGKGTIAKSLVGQFKIQQPKVANFEINSNNFANMFQYYPSNYNEEGKIYTATKVVLSDGQTIYCADGVENTLPEQYIPGTINVCVDGIKNGQKDVNGKDMEVHFDFVIEEQVLADGMKKYVLLDCHYYDKEQTYSVDVMASETPEIDEVNKIYLYDISYTIESTNPAANSDHGNVTQTDPHFFHSDLENGQMKAHLGNNGRISVNLSDAYEKNVTVQKEWFDRLGNKLDNGIAALQNVSITAGIYQTYSYVDENNETQSQNGTTGIPFATAVLNQANGFKYTWTTPALPKYLVNDGGDYVLDKNKQKVPVTYIAGEVDGAAGWTLSEVVDNSTTSEDIYTLQNVPLAEFSPTVQKVWSNTVDGNAPAGYKVKIELLANDDPVLTANKIDTEHVITATLNQANAKADATLHVSFGSVALGSQTVHIQDFGAENTTKSYEFEYEGEDGSGVGGSAGSGSHADKVTVTVEVSNTSGEKLAAANVKVTYHYTEVGTGAKKEATLDAFRTNSVTEGETKTYTYVMYYSTFEKAEVILDGIVDSTETKEWYSELNKWNLPMLDKDDNGNYTAIKYSIRETVYVPDANGGEDIAYTPNNKNLIIIPLAEGGERVFKATTTHTVDYHFTVTNEESLTNVTASKVWLDNNNKYNTRPESITFQLLADGVVQEEYNKTVTPTGETAGIWNGTANVEWNDVPLYNKTTGEKIVYTVAESISYAANQTDTYKVTVTADTEKENHFTVTNSLHDDPAINYTSMDVEKIWEDNNNAYGTRPANLYMVLYRTLDEEGAVAEVVPGAGVVTLSDGNWSKAPAWVNLAKYNEEGKKYTYSVKEYMNLSRNVEGVSGYELISTEVSNDGTKYTFKNQLADGAISKTVTKVWKDAALENQRPATVDVKLTATYGNEELDLTQYVASDGTSAATVNYNPEQQLNSSSWSYTWSNLPEYYKGVKVDYTIEEVKVGDVAVNGASDVTVAGAKYAITLQDDGESNEFVVTNRLTGETSVTVKKKWDVTQAPTEYQIPDVVFDVYNRFHGKLEGKSMTVTSSNLEASVTGLPKYNADGAEYVYTVAEQLIAGTDKYFIDSLISDNTSTDGNFFYTATNTYVPLVQDISGTKTWVGVTGDNIPKSITVALYRQYGNGTPELVTDGNGKALQPDAWVKSEDEKVWTYKYVDLPIYEDNNTEKPYVYSIKETAIDSALKDDFVVKESGLNITNTLGGTVDGADLAGSKTWEGVEEANVPDSIRVQLMRSTSAVALGAALDTEGNEVFITVKKDSQSNKLTWTYNFEGVTLPKYDADGNAYVYSVKEVSVTAKTTTRDVVYSDHTLTAGTVGDYEVTIAGRNITNKLKEESRKDKTVEFPMTKMWAVDNAATVLPGSITVQLLMDGVVVRTEVLTNAHQDGDNRLHWKYTFENLRKYTDDGITEAKYSISETKIADMNVQDGKAGEWEVGISPNGDVIINRRANAATTLIVYKKWENVSAENTPDAITVQLYQNGEALGTPVKITAEEGWKYEFPFLPVSSDGTSGGKHIYTVEEVSVTADGVTEVVKQQGGKIVVGDYVVTADKEEIKLSASSPENNTLTITNTLNDDSSKVKLTYPVEKTWSDAESIDLSKYSVQVQLFQNGTAMSDEYVKTISASVNWKTEYTGLDKYTANGITQHVYTAKETKIGVNTTGSMVYTDVTNGKAGDFFVTYTKQDKEGTVINNRLAKDGVDKELINYPVNKLWKDSNDNDITENLPANITVQLKQNNVALGNAYTFTADDIADDWTHTFKNLRKYADDGLTPYAYSAEETKVGGVAVVGNEVGAWTVQHDASNTKTTITNKLRDAITSVKVTKKWVDVVGNNIPDSIVVELHGGASVQRITMDKSFGVSGVETEWTYTFDNLPVYRADGITKYNYTVTEASVTAGSTTRVVIYTDKTNGTVGDYTVKLDGSMNAGFTITNTLKQGNNKDLTVNYTVRKNWRVPTGATLPESIMVQLLQNGHVIDDKKITAADNWAYTFKNLRKYTDNGITEYVYSVEETKIGNLTVDNGKAGAYIVSIVDNVITNTLTTDPAELFTTLTITKEWVGVKGANIPSMQVQLLRNGEIYRTVQLTRSMLDAASKVENNNGETWTYTFKDLPRYSDGVIPYEYTVRETYVNGVAVESKSDGFYAGDYKVEVNGTQITNTLTGTIAELHVQKIWKDKAEEANRPTEIKVAVVRKSGNGNYENAHLDGKTWTLTKDDWKAVLNNEGNGYPKYDSNGNLYTYRVVEVDTNGNFITDGNKITYDSNQYVVDNSINSDGTFVITNTLYGQYIPGINPIKVTKHWLDDNSPEKRPAQITVRLYQAGVEKEQLNVLSTDGWTKEFTGTYDIYDSEGALIEYTVTEDAIENYTLKELKGNAKDGFELTNVYAPGMTSVVINKVWVDNDNELGKRPADKLTLNLLQNDTLYRHVILNASSTSVWTASQDVPIADENGKVYVYTVEEPEGSVDAEYIATYSDDKLTVTNTLTGEVEVKGTKLWDKIDEQYRPESITVELWRKTKDSVEVQMKDSADKVLTVTTDASKEWKYDFGKMPKYDENGALYEYIIKEVLIGDKTYAESDYVATLVENSYDLKNAIKESTTTAVIVKGAKTWVDDDDKYVTRPETITVNLLCDGKKVNSVQVKAGADGTWTYEFKDLPKYDMETGKPLVYTVEEEPVKWYAVTVNGFDIFNKLDKIPVPEMLLEKTQSVNGGNPTTALTEVREGDVITYTIKLTNNGENILKDIVITDVLPSGLVLKANSITNAGIIKDGVITWTIDSLKVGESVIVSFEVTVPKVEEETTWKNVAKVTCGNDPTGLIEPSNEVVLIEKEPAPETSDRSPITMWTSIMIASLVVCGKIIDDKRRKRI